MNFRENRAFTLIELLVVVAIISVLSTVVVSSIGSSRAKAKDAAIKDQLSSLRAAAELVYTNTGTYDTICNLSTNTGQMFKSAADLNNRVVYQAVCSSSSGNILYTDASGNIVGGGKVPTPDKWGASIKLVRSSNYFCVDYTGIAREQADIGVYFTSNGTSDVDC